MIDDRYAGRRTARWGAVVCAGLAATAACSDPFVPTGMSRILPRDTVIVVGGSYVVEALAFDEDGVTQPVTDYRSLDPSVLRVDGGAVVGLRPGRAAVEGAAGASRDTVWVSVVPDMRIAAFKRPRDSGDDAGFYVLRADLSEVVRVWSSVDPSYTFPHGAEGTMDWDASGTHLVAGIDGRVYDVDLAGQAMRLDSRPLPDSTTGVMHPQASPSGDWIFFGGFSSWYNRTAIWRMQTDGSSIERIGPLPSNGFNDDFPAYDPVSDRVAFGSQRTTAPHRSIITLLTVATGGVTGTGLFGTAPRWSPDGALIAFVDDSGGGLPYESEGRLQLLTVSSGSNRAILAEDLVYRPWLDWSPDGDYILASRYYTGSISPDRVGLEIIEVSSGMRIPIPSTGQFINAAWGP